MLNLQFKTLRITGFRQLELSLYKLRLMIRRFIINNKAHQL